MPQKTVAWVAGICVLTFGLLLAKSLPPMRHPSLNAAEKDDGIPAYHPDPSTEPLPTTVDPKEFYNPAIRNVYEVAGKAKQVLYQMPCYCRCDKVSGHNSLLDCFTDKHGSGCEICLREAAYAYKQSLHGKTAAEIRQEINDGKWKTVDLPSLASKDTLN